MPHGVEDMGQSTHILLLGVPSSMGEHSVARGQRTAGPEEGTSSTGQTPGVVRCMRRAWKAVDLW